MSRLVALLFILPLLARADPLRLDLPRAVEMALARNFSLEVAAYQPRIAAAQITEELGQFDPRLQASYNRFEDTDRRAFDDTERPGSLITRTDAADLSLRGLLPWGMTYDAGIAAVNRRGTDNDFADSFTITPALGATQPLLRDFGPAANLAGLRIARTDARISQWAYRQRIIDVITQVWFVYNDLAFAMENLDVAQRSQNLARQLLRDNEQRAEIGVMSPLNVTTARADVAAREEAVILARRAVRDSENFLKQLITDDIDTLLRRPLTIAPPLSPVVKIDVADGIRAALDWRPDYQQALLDIRRQGINLAFARNQALPRLDLSGSLDLIGFDSGFTRSLGNAFAQDRTAFTVGALFSVPIPNREGRGRVEAAQLRAAQALIELKRLEQDIIVRVDNAAGQIETNRQRIVSTAEARKLAEESLAAGDERLRAGTATTFELLELQTRLSTAEAAELRARSDYNKAVAEYDRQTGLSLERNGVAVE